MKIRVHTRSFNDLLYERMRSFIPDDVECLRHTGYNTWQDAATIIHDVIENYDGINLLIDEDAFITDWRRVRELCEYVQQEGVAFCGMPDGIVIPHRSFCWCVANPFFLILNNDLIKPKKNIPRDIIDSCGFTPEMNKYKPSGFGEHEHGLREIYNGIFYWMLQTGLAPLYLQAVTLGDGITTQLLDHNLNPICIHTWFSRTYNEEANKTRIDFFYRQALEIKK